MDGGAVGQHGQGLALGQPQHLEAPVGVVGRDQAIAVDTRPTGYVEFSYRLDTTQLPSPMQIGLGGQPDWVIRIERELNVPPP